jgi:chaperonin cofactor prefoldin
MKKYIIIGAVILTIGIIGYLYFSLEKTKDALQIANVELSVANDSVSIYRTKAGELVFKIKSVEIEKDNLKAAFEELGIDRKKLKDENIKLKDVIGYLKAEIEASGHVSTPLDLITPLQAKDSTLVRHFAPWSNKFMFVSNGTIYQNKIDFDYLYKVGIEVTPTTNKKETILNMKLTDPKASVISGNSFTVVNEKSWYEKWWITGPIGILIGKLISK